ncbi:hypothetical protein [Bordetella genomosp. 4]|uniref:hypothetical protein n=1 Tax=Bordetella genomosp. 4 TaxID=463044 RepID=UPI000B9E211C|nr:hypothetical protein [Bordetella genomosp. 4]OZI48361.1 hypothetical protein CAL21_10875 [Bordetella genomosp. 4]
MPLEVFAHLKPGKPIVIMFNGAQQRVASLKLPVFSGFGATNADTMSRVFINDPTLYLSENLELGWYAGNSKLNLQELLPQIFEKIFSRARPSKIIFAGGSNGGFAALYYSRLVPGSLAIASNPQTNILKYRVFHVKRYSKVAFALQSLEEAREKLPSLIDFNLGKLYSERRENFVLYMQNSSDHFHVQSHCIPFLETLDPSRADQKISTMRIDSRLFLHVQNWGPGHAGPRKEYWKMLLNDLVTYSSSWNELFAPDGIESLVKNSMNRFDEACHAWRARQANRTQELSPQSTTKVKPVAINAD